MKADVTEILLFIRYSQLRTHSFTASSGGFLTDYVDMLPIKDGNAMKSNRSMYSSKVEKNKEFMNSEK